MKFALTNTTIVKLKDFDSSIFEGDFDYINAYISKIEEAFSQSENIRFTLSCLGENWNVMIFYDFTLFTEHLLDIFKLCNKPVGETYKMWYYEQGIDRTLLFTKTDTDTIKIENISGEKWISPLQSETISVSDLKTNCIEFVNKIKEILNVICPELNELEMLTLWYRSFE